jgi:hypothetical protein
MLVPDIVAVPVLDENDADTTDSPGAYTSTQLPQFVKLDEPSERPDDATVTAASAQRGENTAAVIACNGHVHATVVRESVHVATDVSLTVSSARRTTVARVLVVVPRSHDDDDAAGGRGADGDVHGRVLATAEGEVDHLERVLHDGQRESSTATQQQDGDVCACVCACV